MKKCLFLFCAAVMLCGFSDLAGQAGNLELSTQSRDWEVSLRNNSLVRAFNPESQVEIIIDISSLLPNSPLCVSNKRIKDIKFTLNIYKVAEAGDGNWAKSYEKTRIQFWRPGQSDERKVYGSTLIKNNLVFKPGTVVNVGSLQFLSPITCEDIDGMSMRISGMLAGNRSLPSLEFKIESGK